MNEKLKKDRLRNIKDEVKDLHPLLRSLFIKLPNIKNLEYTHGTYEKGADFILAKQDETLNDIDYIGVIVKIGQIYQSNFMNIKKQIEECNLPRYVVAGKKNIYLNEVWIVNNDNITKNVKEHIYERYKATKVKFIDGDKLIGLIDKYLPNY